MLDISPILLLSVAVVFLIVLARLNSCLYKPLTKHIDERTESIAKDLEAAQNNVADVDSMYEEASHIIAKAKKEASSIRESAYNEAKTLSDSKIANFKEELDNKYNQFVANLEKEAESLKTALVDQMPQFKERVSAKLTSI